MPSRHQLCTSEISFCALCILLQETGTKECLICKPLVLEALGLSYSPCTALVLALVCPGVELTNLERPHFGTCQGLRSLLCTHCNFLYQVSCAMSVCSDCAGRGSHPVCYTDECPQWRCLCWINLWGTADKELWGDFRGLHQPCTSCDRVHPVFLVAPASIEAAATRQYHRANPV